MVSEEMGKCNDTPVKCPVQDQYEPFYVVKCPESHQRAWYVSRIKHVSPNVDTMSNAIDHRQHWQF